MRLRTANVCPAARLRTISGCSNDAIGAGAVGSLLAKARYRAYSGGEEGLSHFDGTAWTHLFGGDVEDVYALWGSSAADVWVLTDYWKQGEDESANFYHFDGKTWTLNFRIGFAYDQKTVRMAALSGTGPNDVWATGDERVMHWDGTSWTKVEAGLPVGPGSWHVGARAPGAVWMGSAGGGARIHSATHFDGQRWSQIPTPAGWLFFSLPGGPLWSFGGAIVRHR